MRRITWWLLSTASAVALLFSYHTSTEGSTPVAASGTPTGGPAPAAAPTTAPTTAGSTTGSSAAGSSTAKTYTGSTAQTRWGPVQVQITVQGGKITRAEAVAYPTGNGRDRQINAYALPVLGQEAVQAQSAHIDMVSGATVTSEGYLTSLQSAIDQAHL